MLLEAWGNFADVDASLETVFVVFVSEAVDQIVLLLSEVGAKLRPQLSVDRAETLKSLFEWLKIEIGRFLVLGVLSRLHLLLQLSQLSSFAFGRGFFVFLATILVGLCLLVPI